MLNKEGCSVQEHPSLLMTAQLFEHAGMFPQGVYKSGLYLVGHVERGSLLLHNRRQFPIVYMTDAGKQVMLDLVV